jgi:iron complex outermembrane receptor protein
MFELYYDAPGNEANPSLGPETVKTMELVWEQYLPNRLLMTVSGFDYPIRHLINQQVDPANGAAFFDNAGSLDLRGLEIAVSRSVPGGLRGRLSYSFQDAANASNRVALTNSPKHLIQASLSVPVIQREVFASMDLQYMSRRATLTGAYSGAYIVPNFTLFRRSVSDNWELSASFYNAFNRKYADPVGNGLAENEIVQDGRTFRITVGYKFHR